MKRFLCFLLVSVICLSIIGSAFAAIACDSCNGIYIKRLSSSERADPQYRTQDGWRWVHQVTVNVYRYTCNKNSTHAFSASERVYGEWEKMYPV